MLNLLRAEILKYSRLKIILFIAFSSVLITLLVVGAMVILKLAGVDFGNVPAGLGLLEIGGGTFGLAANIIIVGVNGIYLIGLVITGAMVGSNEFGWHTIKMLATREASRPRLILSKTLFLLVMAAFMAGMAALCWLFLGLIFKALYIAGDTGSLDGDAIGKGFLYLLFTFGVNFLWSVMVMFLAVRFKSVVVAIIFYFIVNTLDGIVSSLGEAALSGQLGTSFPNWLEPLINIAKFISPFLVNFSLNQLTVSPHNLNFVQSVPAVQSIGVLLAWIGLYIWAAVAVFRRRDITE
jgi:ABC-type transport system involved in multi-copper enzyme maturation permease subunit